MPVPLPVGKGSHGQGLTCSTDPLYHVEFVPGTAFHIDKRALLPGNYAN
jgi:hypothetical protein